MSNKSVETTDDLSDLLEIVGEKDQLLKSVVERLRRERSGEAVDWFKHGDHGSHNSG